MTRQIILTIFLLFSISQTLAFSCGNPMKPPFSSYNYSGYSDTDTVVHYSCFYGYKINGSSTRRCLSDGTWSPEMPKCVSLNKTCGFPSVGLHASVNLNGTRFPQYTEAMYRCDLGFVLVGTPTRMCQVDGTWTQPEPFCAAKLSMYKRIVQVSQNVDVNLNPRQMGSAIVDDTNMKCSVAQNADTQKSFWKLDLMEKQKVDIIILIFGEKIDVNLELKYSNVDSFKENTITSSQFSLSKWTTTFARQLTTYEYILKDDLQFQFLTVEAQPIKRSTINFCEILVLSKSAQSFGQCYSDRVGSLSTVDTTATMLNDTCYSFVHVKDGSWPTAETQCKELTNGSLVRDVDERVQQMMRLNLEGAYNGMTVDKNFWIGGHTEAKMDTKGKYPWTWPSNESIENFFWGRNQPNMEMWEPSCLSLSGKLDWQWDDRPCSHRLNYVCQHGVLKCGAIDTAEHIIIDRQNLKSDIGSRVAHKCDQGYILMGDEYRQCLEDGRWSGSTPYCYSNNELWREKQRDEQELGVGVIIAIVCAAIVGAFLMIALIIFLVYRHDKSGSHKMKFSKQSESAETLDVEDRKGANYSSTEATK